MSVLIAMMDVKQTNKKPRENGKNVTSFGRIAFVAIDMGWP